ncbi:trimeric LpxA-like protein [Sporormia fimetaria CBS 119925]|uniref:Trimeric LpxA-like protein n=1 Tax=Sporormia fimetaria CBS 119925 TaxID=1340428 RepID=A0A6A6V7B3_9PLEO|nr:trimeric LpxA-like protein [Sporormia fimetaria CBS 119925]
MPSPTHPRSKNSVDFMLEDPTGRHLTSVNGNTSPTASFTAVNRASPPRLNSLNGMPPDTLHVRNYSPSHSDSAHEQKPLPSSEQWHPVRQVPQGHSYPTSNGMDRRDQPSPAPGSRKRPHSEDTQTFLPSPHSAAGTSSHQVSSYASPEASPPLSHSATMDSQRSLPPPASHGDQDGWRHDASHYRPTPDAATPGPQQITNGTLEQSPQPDAGMTTVTRAGVQIDTGRKRKRQFANRTKTGCGTCRRRKKKCDEGKPECNNCTRGTFICEGYANKVPWPKNGTCRTRPPPLQAKVPYSEAARLEPAPLQAPQLYHRHGTSYQQTPESGRPIMTEEPASWNTWSEPPPSQSQGYAPPPPPAPQPPPSARPEHYVQQPAPLAPAPQRQHRIYHHTPQTMSQVHNNASPAAPELPSSSSAVPGPPTHYASPPHTIREKCDKDKMLSGEPFSPYNHTLLTERELCANVVHRFNMTSNERVQITRDERYRHFQALVAAKWVPRADMDHHRGGSSNSVTYMTGYVGSEVLVDTPFHCDYGYNLVIQDCVSIGPGCKFLDSAKITIGRNSTISANVTIETHRIPTDSKTVKGSRGLVVAMEVSIGENVWIGAGAIIGAGVKIGTGAIVQPGSVVLKDVPRDCVVKGNPANVLAVNWDE